MTTTPPAGRDPAASLAAALLRQQAQAEKRPVPTDDEIRAELAALTPERPAHMQAVFDSLDAIEAGRQAHVQAYSAQVADIAEAVVERLRQEQPAPKRRSGSERGRSGPRHAVSDAVRTAVNVAELVRKKGLPKGERKWTLEALGFAMADWWPQQPAPRVRTLQGYVREALKAGFMEPLKSW